MFKKILIANRGEIACRIIRTARRMGIACVAVHSEADRRASFVAIADEAVAIGPAPPAESYLATDKIIAACLATGAEAVHPGYGFLSENAGFAEAVATAGLIFIGPNPKAIALMGDKLAAKALARRACVAVLPDSSDPIEDAASAKNVADAIGYPVMLKPAAGGGGKGMRIVRGSNDLERDFDAARSEAAAAFGDDRLFIEKFIEHPRHIEVQILGDRFGNLIHLGERECSIQRRHQKLIEETPSPFVDPAMRAAMTEQALSLAKSADYDSAGTVEFLVDSVCRAFYFLEMNTRLQVEHPVTELVTRLDLVEEMIKVAAGERLALSQKDIQFKGAAIETRICAEDPAHGFAPSVGRITTLRLPQEGTRGGITIRHDMGVVEGSEVTPHYDPMIGKLICHAGDRPSAIAAMADALDQCVIDGICTNVGFLAALVHSEPFRTGDLSTDFIAQTYPQGFAARQPEDGELTNLAVVAASLDQIVRMRQKAWDAMPEHTRCVFIGECRIDMRFGAEDAAFRIRLSNMGEIHHCQTRWHPGLKLWTGTIDSTPFFMQVRPHLHRFFLQWRGIGVNATVNSPREAELAALLPKTEHAKSEKFLRSPMPGLLKRLDVRPGQNLAEGDIIGIIEAMKMETQLRAEAAGIVKDIFVEAGASLAVDEPILEFA